MKVLGGWTRSDQQAADAYMYFYNRFLKNGIREPERILAAPTFSTERRYVPDTKYEREGRRWATKALSCAYVPHNGHL